MTCKLAFVRKLLFWRTIQRWFDEQFKASFDAVKLALTEMEDMLKA
jgi:hypothetical protein